MRFYLPTQLTFLRVGLVVAVATVLFFVTGALRLFGFQRTQRCMSHFAITPLNRDCATKKRHVDNVIYALDALENRVFKFNCLSRVVAASFFLARCGIATQMRFGVRKDGEKFGSHAWLELDDRIIVGGENSDQNYVPLAFPSKRCE